MIYDNWILNRVNYTIANLLISYFGKVTFRMQKPITALEIRIKSYRRTIVTVGASSVISINYQVWQRWYSWWLTVFRRKYFRYNHLPVSYRWNVNLDNCLQTSFMSVQSAHRLSHAYASGRLRYRFLLLYSLLRNKCDPCLQVKGHRGRIRVANLQVNIGHANFASYDMAYDTPRVA